MSKIFHLLFVAALVTPLMAQTPAEKSQALYQAGLAAEKAGDPATARLAYQDALNANPQNANARYRLGELKLHSADIASKGRETKMNAVIIPLYQLEGASLQESVDALGNAIAKESKGEVTPNFIIQDPEGRFKDKKLTFQLKAVPAKAVIDYILAQVGGKARYDEHAIVIVPR